MHQIKPITAMTREECRDMANAAAERDEPLHQANPFEPGTTQHTNFSSDYWARHRELVETAQ